MDTLRFILLYTAAELAFWLFLERVCHLYRGHAPGRGAFWCYARLAARSAKRFLNLCHEFTQIERSILSEQGGMPDATPPSRRIRPLCSNE